ncbi:MAG: hypothetical protein OER90_08870, partial [Gemmatimonadota bacterium]|nr:hypothetical protein [Gemmatimonadota bacterium]
PETFYMGATGGGVWKTTDYGQVWRNVSDGYFQTGSIGAIRVANSDPNVVYVGTGSDGIRSNVIAGRGVYRSSDAGETWSFIGLRDVGQIGAVLIHPNDPNIVYVAAIGHAFGPSPERGVYRSLDAGRHWDRVLFVSDSTGAVDLEFAPDNPREIYAAMWRAERKPWTIISGAREGGIYKSSDGGETWRKLVNGLPAELIGKSDLAVSAAAPNRLYVLMEAEPSGGLYRSDDRGESFRLISTQRGILNRPFYYTNVDAAPSDADMVYINNEGFFRSENGGQSFERRSTPHGDNHDMWINPKDPNLFIQSNDGGVNVTLNGGVTWSSQSNQPTAELYQVDIDDQFPYWLYAGQQDNSTIAVPSLPPYPATRGGTSHWLSIGGCETGPAVPKPGNADIVYANCKGRFGRYSKRTGQEKQYYVGAANMYGHNPRDLRYRFQRVSPIEISPHDPDVVYHASQFLHVTRDEGVTWETISPDLTAFEPDKQVVSGGPINRDITGEEFYSTIYAVEESPLEPGLIWVGANDGPIHVTRDGGKTWDNVTPADLPPNGRVQHIDPSPHRPGKAYAAVYRYLLGDWQPYIYRTTDYGQSWTRLTTGTNGIPMDSPTRVVREDPDREGLLYAGTEFGVFISFDDGASWQSFQQNLPVTPVTDLKVYRKDLVISTMGRSFWIMDNLTPLHQLTPQVTNRPYALFAPRNAYRLRYSWATRSPADPQYPPQGAAIDYYLAREPVEGLTLEILDAGGAVIRAFTSGHQLGPPTAARGMGGPATRARHSTRLTTSPGVHRFVWDLRAEGSINPRTQRSSGSGPMVPPGQYEVRLRAGDWVEQGPLTVLIDPRTAADGVSQSDLMEQYTFGIEVRDAITGARAARHRLEELKQRAPRAGGRAVRQLEELEAQLMTRQDIRYPQPMLESQLEYLSSMIDRADQKIGNDAKLRYQELRTDLDRIRTAIAELAAQIGD